MNCRSFERFSKTGGIDLEALMLTDEGKTPLMTLDSISQTEEYPFTATEKGHHIVSAVLKSDAQSLAQMTVRLFVDGNCKLTLAVNGSAGKEFKFVREIWLNDGDHKVTFKYDEEMVQVVSFGILK